jgi:hypothetical protein
LRSFAKKEIKNKEFEKKDDFKGFQLTEVRKKQVIIIIILFIYLVFIMKTKKSTEGWITICTFISGYKL